MMESLKIKEIQSKMESHPNPEVIIFSSRHDNEVGWLSKILKHFESNGVNLMHIESRCSSRIIGHYDFMVECWARSVTEIDKAVEMVRADCDWLSIISRNVQSKDTVPWFPLKIRDLDKYSNQILSYGAELNSDHPGFTDPKYRERRKYFADIAYNYKHGQPLPIVNYTDDEIQTWSVIFKKLVSLYPTLACKEYNQVFPLLIENCGYREDNIPQLEDVSNFLKECTGFTLRPVAGLLSSRDFLAGLAFRVFHCTQYIRHPSKPFYTPEPDVCHELLGHAPLFADPSFAQFAQEIGLASLGAPDDYIVRLATCFWFTVEYGICIQDSKRKAYGAGLLSSYGELKYAIEDQTAEYKTFDPPETALQSYPITDYQPVYFVAESFEDAKDKMIKYASSIPRSFQVRYNAYTQSVEILNSKLKVENLIQTVNSEMQVLLDSLKKLNQSGGGADGNVVSVGDSEL